MNSFTPISPLPSCPAASSRRDARSVRLGFRMRRNVRHAPHIRALLATPFLVELSRSGCPFPTAMAVLLPEAIEFPIQTP